MVLARNFFEKFIKLSNSNVLVEIAKQGKKKIKKGGGCKTAKKLSKFIYINRESLKYT